MIQIRPVTTMEECRHIAMITASAWGDDPAMAVPDHLIITLARENGSVVLLAWDDETPVGFCLGFLSYTGREKRLKHCSHMAAVLPQYRGKRVGEKLKWAQRAAVLEMGIDHITWTYDPLETLNGRLNVHKLGVTCQSYKRDNYGETSDDLGQGLPTDRFHVDWWIDSPWVRAHEGGTHRGKTFPDLMRDRGAVVNVPVWAGVHPRPGDFDVGAFGSPHPMIAVPRDFQRMKRSSIEQASAWRLHTRELFERAFAAGLSVIDLLLEEELCYYLLGTPDVLSPESG
jgi:predicted GNAT superfamily acetyltransferase